MPAEGFEIIGDSAKIVPDRSLDNWYEYAGKDHFWIAWRFKILVEILKSNGIQFENNLKVMDIGSGNGVAIEYFDQLTNWNTDGVDIDRVALERSFRGKGRLLYYDINIREEQFRETYDIIFVLDVIEHIKTTHGFLESVLFHLKPGGCIVVNTPAFQRLFGAYDRAAMHLRRYNRNTLAAELEDFEVDILDSRYWGMSLLPLVIMRNLVIPKNADNKEVIRVGFSPPLPAINSLLTLIMRMETFFFKRPPFGTSISLIARKK